MAGPVMLPAPIPRCASRPSHDRSPAPPARIGGALVNPDPGTAAAPLPPASSPRPCPDLITVTSKPASRRWSSYRLPVMTSASSPSWGNTKRLAPTAARNSPDIISQHLARAFDIVQHADLAPDEWRSRSPSRRQAPLPPRSKPPAPATRDRPPACRSALRPRPASSRKIGAFQRLA